ncbi:MAG: hypothetical protein JXR73_06970 [Candidatus Omnitrophica bacterium]|nr:hypothetical protein [Candidatus Omnitrophota bacterium]
MRKKIGFISLFLLAGAMVLYAQEPVGIFDGAVDIGETGFEGFAEFESDTDFYLVDASGTGIDDFADSFYFVYKELSGNFSIEGLPYVYGGRAGLMIRQNLEAGSPFGAYVLDSSGNIFPLFRTLPNEASSDDGEVTPDMLLDGSMKLERIGNSVHFYTLNTDAEWEWQQTEIIQLNDPVYVGLAAASGSDELGFYEYEQIEIEEYPFFVSREFGSQAPAPGDAMTVTLSASSSAVSNATVTEIAPAGSIVSNLAADGGEFIQLDDETIQWSLNEFSGEASLTYSIELPSRPVIIWNGMFTDGELNVMQDGLREGYIGGDLYVAETLGLQPRDSLSVHPIIPRFIEAEWGRLTGEERPFGLHLNPFSESGILLQAADGSSSVILDSILEYTLDVQEAGTYYFFAQTREEDSQSDSFFFGFDEISTSKDNAFSAGGTKELARDWLQNYDPNGEFWDVTGEVRPIELTAGVHTLYISPRETNTSIDWFVITTDPTMNIDQYEPGEQFFAAIRNLPSTGAELPDSIDVSIDLGVVQGSNIDLRLEEQFPEGWTASNVSADPGTFEIVENAIVWEAPGANADGRLTYTIAPPADAIIGFFDGFAESPAAGVVQPIIGGTHVPQIFSFQLKTDPIDVAPDAVTFIQAESPHAFSGDYVVDADPSLISLLYAMPASSGRSGGVMGDQELTFELNVLEDGVYYIFANARSEDSNTDSFYIGFDLEFPGMSDGAESDVHAYAVPSRMEFARRWQFLFEEGQRFWVVTDEPRPHELTAGAHTLHWHSREPQAKVDWIGITTDPTLDLDEILEPGQTPDTAVSDFMLY